MQIILGPSGSPLSSSLEGLHEVKRLGLHAMELSFTHGVRMGIETAKDIGEANKTAGLRLSIHAPYYINLCSEDAQKRTDSVKRILETCERAHHIGATKVIFHPGYYGKLTKEETFQTMKSSVEDMMKTIRANGWKAELAPETTGRLTQFGSLEETLEMSKQTGCSLCVDIAHIYARNLGEIEYRNVFDVIEQYGHKQVNFHFEGIRLNKGGEGSHLEITGNQPDFREFATELLKRNINGTIISESPATWRDSLVMKQILESLGHNFQKE